uniref:Ig-like domain-containing protein n=1 Tax=Aquila chrysaetos chrysaetos TaxID=223781 RepID=A0A663F1C6_AQUCH
MPSLAFFNSSSKCCCLQTGQFHILPPNNPITGFIGEDVILPCQLSLTVFPRSITVQWVALQPFRTLKEISYNEAVKDSWLEERSWGGTELFLSQWSTGNLSLKLKNAQVPDKGKYICRVTAGQWHDQVAIELEVTGQCHLFFQSGVQGLVKRPTADGLVVGGNFKGEKRSLWLDMSCFIFCVQLLFQTFSLPHMLLELLEMMCSWTAGCQLLAFWQTFLWNGFFPDRQN